MTKEGFDSKEIKDGFSMPQRDYHKEGEKALVETAKLGEMLEPQFKKISETLKERMAFLNKKKEELENKKNALINVKKNLALLENTTVEELNNMFAESDEGLKLSGEDIGKLQSRKEQLEKEIDQQKKIVRLFEADLQDFKDKTFS